MGHTAIFFTTATIIITMRNYFMKMYLMCTLTKEIRSPNLNISFLPSFISSSANPYPDVRRRYWNAYMLFYQRVSEQNSPVLPKKSRVSVVRQEAEDLTL